MNWDGIEGDWKQMAGKVKQKWGKLTDDDFMKMKGKREQLEGALQARYGFNKDEMKKEIDSWSSGL